jgi:hypothetical protein
MHFCQHLIKITSTPRKLFRTRYNINTDMKYMHILTSRVTGPECARGVRGNAPRKCFDSRVSEMASPAFWEYFWLVVLFPNVVNCRDVLNFKLDCQNLNSSDFQLWTLCTGKHFNTGIGCLNGISCILWHMLNSSDF